MGKVGAGWNRTTSSQIRKALDAVESPESKLTKAVKKPKATWVDPVFTADIEYRDVTSEGLLRQSSFKGLKRNAALKSVFHYMSEPFPHLMDTRCKSRGIIWRRPVRLMTGHSPAVFLCGP